MGLPPSTIPMLLPTAAGPMLDHLKKLNGLQLKRSMKLATAIIAPILGGVFLIIGVFGLLFAPVSPICCASIPFAPWCCPGLWNLRLPGCAGLQGAQSCYEDIDRNSSKEASPQQAGASTHPASARCMLIYTFGNTAHMLHDLFSAYSACNAMHVEQAMQGRAFCSKHCQSPEVRVSFPP